MKQLLLVTALACGLLSTAWANPVQSNEPVVVVVDSLAAEDTLRLLQNGEQLSASQIERLLKIDGEQIAIVLRPETLKSLQSSRLTLTEATELRGALAHSLGRPSSPLRLCTAEELEEFARDDVTRFIILPAGRHCRQP